MPESKAPASSEAAYGGGRTDAKAAEKEENVLEKNNETIISTFRIRVDECDRLWVMDSGLADILGAPKQWAPNSIAIFDLNTDKLIRRFVIPEDQVKGDSFFANIVSFFLTTCFSFSKLVFKTPECFSLNLNCFRLARSLTQQPQAAEMLSLTFPTWARTLSLFMTSSVITRIELSTTSSISTRCRAI